MHVVWVRGGCLLIPSFTVLAGYWIAPTHTLLLPLTLTLQEVDGPEGHGRVKDAKVSSPFISFFAICYMTSPSISKLPNYLLTPYPNSYTPLPTHLHPPALDGREGRGLGPPPRARQSRRGPARRARGAGVCVYDIHIVVLACVWLPLSRSLLTLYSLFHHPSPYTLTHLTHISHPSSRYLPRCRGRTRPSIAHGPRVRVHVHIYVYTPLSTC